MKMMKIKNIKITVLVANIIAIAVMCAILVGSTFAWFTDSVSSGGNKIQSGTLKVDLEMLDKEEGWISLKNEDTPIFNYSNWEPGYTDIKILKVENEGSLALKWKAKIVANGELSELADVIDVYVLPSRTELAYPTDRDLEGYTCVGTVADFVNGIETTTTGTLLANESSYLGIALKMRSDAGNEYQDLDLLGTFDIMIVATQLSSEGDGFGTDYDEGASLDFTPVANANQLVSAIKNGDTNIVLTENIVVDETFDIDYDVNIDGGGYALMRQSVATYSATASEVYDSTFFNVGANATLELTNITLDGGAIWAGEVDEVLGRGTENVGVTSSNSIITAGANSSIILGEGVVIQNVDGAIAINLGTRVGATLTIDGAEIINNNSGAGAIWGGGHITMYSGKINNNSSTGLAGAIRMVSNCNLTMYGGQINNNTAVTTGGAIYGYGASTFVFEGGEMSGNRAAVGGAIYTGDGSVVTMKNDFKMLGNTADEAGAMRLSNRTTFKMEGGYIADNISTNNSGWNGFYGWNPAVTLSGGEIKDNICIQGGLIPIVGGSKISGVIYFSLGTNHNTCILAEDFGVVYFHVAEGNNFAAFNFKPADTYVYTEGDEAKLVCVNEGYVTYYDTVTSTFRIKAAEQPSEQ